MGDNELLEFLINYQKKHPTLNEKELLIVYQQARRQAMITSMPTYQPLTILDKKEILMDFEEHKQTVKHVQYKDESTQEFD